MKILCIHGAASSSEIFRMQILPLIYDLEGDSTATFHFIQGTYSEAPPNGYEDFFSPPPHFSFWKNTTVENLEENGLVQNFSPDQSTPEEAMREILPAKLFKDPHGLAEEIHLLTALIESEGPFQGILGFSMGSQVAATVLACHMQNCEAKGTSSMFKFAVFYCGGPPFNPSGEGMLLADEVGEVYRFPTCHVIGAADPLIDASMALYNLCDPETAVIFDHAKGHQLVWAPGIVKNLASTLRKMIRKIEVDEIEGQPHA